MSWSPVTLEQSHPPLKPCSASDVKEHQTARPTAIFSEASSSVLSILVQGLSCCDRLKANLSSQPVQMRIPDGSALNGFKQTANLFQIDFPQQYLENSKGSTGSPSKKNEAGRQS